MLAKICPTSHPAGEVATLPAIPGPRIPSRPQCVLISACGRLYNRLHVLVPLRPYVRAGGLQNAGAVWLRPWHLPYSAACGLKGVLEPAS